MFIFRAWEILRKHKQQQDCYYKYHNIGGIIFGDIFWEGFMEIKYSFRGCKKLQWTVVKSISSVFNSLLFYSTFCFRYKTQDSVAIQNHSDRRFTHPPGKTILIEWKSLYFSMSRNRKDFWKYFQRRKNLGRNTPLLQLLRSQWPRI